MVPITDRVPFPLFLLQSSTEIGLVYVIMIVMMCRGAREAGPEEQPHIISAMQPPRFSSKETFAFVEEVVSSVFNNIYDAGVYVDFVVILACYFAAFELFDVRKPPIQHFCSELFCAKGVIDSPHSLPSPTTRCGGNEGSADLQQQRPGSLPLFDRGCLFVFQLGLAAQNYSQSLLQTITVY